MQRMSDMPVRQRIASGVHKAARRQHGGALVEYTVVALLLVLVLVADPNAIPQLAKALRDVYASFVYALSVSWI